MTQRSQPLEAVGSLVIAIGNPLRGDDGAAAQLVAGLRWRRVDGLPGQQPDGLAGASAVRRRLVAEPGRAGRPAGAQSPAMALPALRQVQQLTPELSADLAVVARVLFVDAWLVPLGVVSPGGSGLDHGVAAPEPVAPEPLLRPLQIDADSAADAGSGAFSHQLAPVQLLAITRLLFGAAPAAWELLLPAHRLGHGEGLSDGMRRQLPRARALLRRWCHADRGEGCLQAAAARADVQAVGGEQPVRGEQPADAVDGDVDGRAVGGADGGGSGVPDRGVGGDA